MKIAESCSNVSQHSPDFVILDVLLARGDEKLQVFLIGKLENDAQLIVDRVEGAEVLDDAVVIRPLQNFDFAAAVRLIVHVLLPDDFDGVIDAGESTLEDSAESSASKFFQKGETFQRHDYE